MLDKVGTYEFIAEPFHCDFMGKMAPGHFCNALLNAADYHSNDRGFGIHYLKTIDRAWVLSRLCVEMNKMPLAYQHFNIDTWVESAMRHFTLRNFAIHSSDTVFAYGRSVWAMIDSVTRQPADLLSVNDGDIARYVESGRVCPIEQPSRVKMPTNSALATTIDTTYSDIDINGHVNSIKYIEHILNLWQPDWYAAHELKRIDIAYVAETHYGDKMSLYKADANDCFYVSAKRSRGNNVEETEVCRAKVVFK